MALEMEGMSFKADEKELKVNMREQNIMTINGNSRVSVYIKYEVLDGKAFIYVKNDIPINAYTLHTNSKIDYNFKDQTQDNEIMTISKWTNIHNSDNGKIAGFTALDYIQNNDYDLFVVLSNVHENFELIGNQIFKSTEGKTLTYRII